MTRNSVRKQRFCGNCGYHNAYEYPSRVFCFKRYGKGEPVVDTLWCCDEWNASGQECYCVEEAVKLQQQRDAKVIAKNL